MRAGWLIAVVVLLLACGKKSNTYEIKRDVQRKSTKSTGLPGGTVGVPQDAKPSVTIKGATGALADGLKKKLESSAPANRGGVRIEFAELEPKSPSGDGTLRAVLLVEAHFFHPPKMSRLEATLGIKLEHSNTSAERLGEELGDVVNDWFEGEKLPANIGPRTGNVPKVTRIASGPPSCTLHEDGSVRCWSYEAGAASVIPDAGNSIAVDAANNFGACGVRKNGSAWCMDAWDNTIAMEIRDVCGIAGATDVSVGQSTGCALLADGHVQCWPRDATSFAPCGKEKPVEVQGLTDAISIVNGAFTACATRKDGSVACWRHGSDPKESYKSTPVKELAKARDVVVQYGPCGIVGPDKVTCAKTKDFAANETKIPEPIKQITGGHELCSLSESGNVFCGHANIAPLKVEGLADITMIDGELGGTCGVTGKNEVICWGGMSGDDPPKPVELMP